MGRTGGRWPRGVGLTGLRTTRMGALVALCSAKDLEQPTPKLRGPAESSAEAAGPGRVMRVALDDSNRAADAILRDP